jgi:hypothetical protein
MDQSLQTPASPPLRGHQKSAHRRASRRQGGPNVLRAWFDQKPPPMKKVRFAQLLGVTTAYVSQLVGDTPPWPGRDLAQRIGIITEGAVTPNDLAGYPPSD